MGSNWSCCAFAEGPGDAKCLGAGPGDPLSVIDEFPVVPRPSPALRVPLALPLPAELLRDDILPRLNVVDLAVLRAVCHATCWQLVTVELDRRIAHLHTTIGHTVTFSLVHDVSRIIVLKSLLPDGALTQLITQFLLLLEGTGRVAALPLAFTDTDVMRYGACSGLQCTMDLESAQQLLLRVKVDGPLLSRVLGGNHAPVFKRGSDIRSNLSEYIGQQYRRDLPALLFSRRGRIVIARRKVLVDLVQLVKQHLEPVFGEVVALSTSEVPKPWKARWRGAWTYGRRGNYWIIIATHLEILDGVLIVQLINVLKPEGWSGSARPSTVRNISTADLLAPCHEGSGLHSRLSTTHIGGPPVPVLISRIYRFAEGLTGRYGSEGSDGREGLVVQMKMWAHASYGEQTEGQ
ncbi:unnamed protein product [Vitrella brassicaformis CCMP3155]|uniref:Uncharacterized protein n=2 Tax=Vitrella brassicaformis TaxID=1169539 RepID=A0A0G4E9H9_VITBC|nr:unnamed protein product [Vitrella brassicaformis CCMP3155]|eukprot:CEL92257.1 unnamed protein product [Vitrella brassicaformis CCMP3155]